MLTVALILAMQAAAPPPPPAFAFPPDGAKLVLEIALTDAQKAKGLMGRKELPPDHGMLFLFPTDQLLTFWMKSTLIPLDIVWLTEKGRVADLKAGLAPCTKDPCTKYEPRTKARAALLVNAGYTAAHGIAPGSQLRFEGVPLGENPWTPSQSPAPPPTAP